MNSLRLKLANSENWVFLEPSSNDFGENFFKNSEKNFPKFWSIFKKIFFLVQCFQKIAQISAISISGRKFLIKTSQYEFWCIGSWVIKIKNVFWIASSTGIRYGNNIFFRWEENSGILKKLCLLGFFHSFLYLWKNWPCNESCFSMLTGYHTLK